MAERPGVLTLQAAHIEYGLSERRMRAAISANELKAHKVGRMIYLERHELERWITTPKEKDDATKD